MYMDASASHMLIPLWETVRRTLWAPLAVLALHFSLRILGAYHVLPNLDLVVHFLGGLAISFVAARFVARARSRGLFISRHRAFEALLIFSFTMTAAVCWEYLELLFDRFSDPDVDSGRINTMDDLAAGMAGSASFITLWWVRNGRRRPHAARP